MTVIELINKLESFPLEEEELLNKEIKLRIRSATGQYNQVVPIKELTLEKLLGKETITISSEYVS